MKKSIMLLVALTVAGCSRQPAPQENSPAVGMPNPASVYCIQQSGTLERGQTADGEINYCHLPSGERIEEWTLFRRDRP
ncbi:hemolysin [Mixta theicola]|uniref:Hemolysin n=1 Tax=Mixta theicola TaxID=1458355 RepID=A0A2K1QAH1_9GAMM|nr:DUF333 domain-containing protein [Mixta theicola]PNS12028.1 hemolysin [Mixta theicola]GLR10811.1 hypothetical protein GCM10007905_35310 [Mixta theicola]